MGKFLRKGLSNSSLLLVVLIVTTVSGVLWLVRGTIIHEDKLFVIHSQEMVSSALTQKKNQLMGALREYSMWDAMAEHCNGSEVDIEWLKSNMSGSAFTNQNINIEAVIDSQQHMDYVLLDGKFVEPSYTNNTLTTIIAELYPIAKRFNPYVKKPSPMGFIKVNEQGVDIWYLAIVEPIVPEKGTQVPHNRRYLLFAEALNAKWIELLGENFKLLNPSITSTFSPSFAHVDLRNAQGQLTGYLNWQLDSLGSTIFSAIMPYVMMLLMALIGIALLLGRLTSRLKNHQLLQALRLVAQGDALRDLTQSKESVPSTDAYAQDVVNVACTTLQLAHISVWQLSEDQQTLIIKAKSELLAGVSVFGQTIARIYAPWLFAVLDNQANLVVKQAQLVRESEQLINIGSSGALLAMPILVNDNAIGVVLGLSSTSRNWQLDEINFFASISSMIALAIESQARKRAEQALQHQIYFDQLTGLPNRVCFNQQVIQLFHNKVLIERYACILIKVEGLISINDRYGIDTGDQLLVAAANRLRYFCGEGELLGKIGDNCFALLLDFERGASLAQRMDMLFGFFSSPVKTQNLSLLVRLKAGTCLLTHAQALDLTLHHAEIALQALTARGRENDWLEYSPEHSAAERDAQQLREDLQLAINNHELFVVYQPVIDFADNRVIGAEALLRWQHPQRGMINPMIFIPLAESNGAIIDIGLWVLREAIKQFKQWQCLVNYPLTLSVNVSMIQLEQHSFADEVELILLEEQFNSSALELEVTEGIALSSTSDVDNNLTRLRALGVSLAIDDFGTDYASFSYLRRFEVGKIKIDRSFLDAVPADKRNTKLVRMIIAMGHTLNAKVTAEGVETAIQATFLREAGCEFGQGYYFHRPLSEDKFLILLQNTLPDAA